MTDASTDGRRGRRPGEGNAREDIVNAARTAFSRDGFALTSIRGVARDAGVDPALVRHYFHSKENLFTSVIRLPFDPETAVRRVTEAGPANAGSELATVLSEILADPERSEQVVAMIRAAATEPQGAHLIRGALNDALIAPIMRTLDTNNPELRAALASSQLIGFLMATLIIEFQPLTTLDAQGIINAVAPALQHTLTGSAK